MIRVKGEATTSLMQGAGGRGREYRVVQAERNEAPWYGTPRADSIRATGWHFSQKRRGTLVSSAYGTGLRGSSTEQFLAAADPRSRSRLFFYGPASQAASANVRVAQ